MKMGEGEGGGGQMDARCYRPMMESYRFPYASLTDLLIDG